MADRKLSVLTELAATPANNDEVYIRDVSEPSADESKRITIANLLADVADLTGSEIVALLEALGSGSQLSHDELDDVSVNDHHAQSHSLASHSTRAHSELSDAPEGAHHTKFTTTEHSSIGNGAPHHTKYTDSNARSAAVSDTAYAGSWNGVTTIAPSKNAVYDKIETLGAGGSLVVWKDASTLPLNDANRTTTLTWTDLDLTASTSADAKIAILRIHINMDSWTSDLTLLEVRKNGTAPSYVTALYGRHATANHMAITAICGMDTGEVIEYQIRIFGTAQIDSIIMVLGYIE